MIKLFEAPDDKRLVLAIEDAGIEILHRCGGYARCTTCRVQFVKGEPDKITEAEKERLTANNLLDEYRLSCQILCDQDMTIEPAMTMQNSDVDDPGRRPQDEITPEAVWTTK